MEVISLLTALQCIQLILFQIRGRAKVSGCVVLDLCQVQLVSWPSQCDARIIFLSEMASGLGFFFAFFFQVTYEFSSQLQKLSGTELHLVNWAVNGPIPCYLQCKPASLLSVPWLSFNFPFAFLACYPLGLENILQSHWATSVRI